MKNKKLILLLIGFACCSFLPAQFTTDFSSAEGYVAGDLTSNASWNGPPGAFTVDASGSGTVAFDPTDLWQAAAYVGPGGVMSTNNYTASSVFTLDFSTGQSSSIVGALVLGLYEFRNASRFSEYSGFGLRQTEGAGTFNMFVINTLNGSNATAFSGAIAAEDLGLSVDGSGNWMDGTSDELALSYSLQFDGTSWNQALTLTNLTLNLEVISVSLSSTDDDASFRDADQTFRISTDKMNQNPVMLTIDEIEITASQPPSDDPLFPIIPGEPSGEPLVTVVSDEYPGALSNPLKGFRPDLGSRSINHEYATLARHYIRWNQIENDESDTIEKILDFCNQQWAGVEHAGIKVIPRVYLDWDGRTGNEYWPADLEDMDYSSDQFKERLRRLIARLGQAWDNDPRVAWVQMGLIGRWGEHHNPYLSSEMQTLLGDAFSEAFKNKKFLVRHADEFMDYEVGYYWDSWAHIYQTDRPKHGAGIDSINKTTGRWKTHPIEGEVAYNWGDYEIQPGSSPNDTLNDPVHRDFLLDLIRRLHCSALGWISEYNALHPAVAAGAAEVQKAFGYRFLISEFSCSPRTEHGGNLDIAFSVLNTGSAPFLADWPVELSLLDPATGEPAWRTFLDDVDIRSWLPGTDWDDATNAYRTPAVPYTVEQSVPLPSAGDLPPGEYIIALSIVDPAGHEPAVRFAVTHYHESGRHPFGNIGVGVDVETGHFLNPAGFDDPMEMGRLPYRMPLSSEDPDPGQTSLSIGEGVLRLECEPSGASTGVLLQRSTNLRDWQTISVKSLSGAPVIFFERLLTGEKDFFRILAF